MDRERERERGRSELNSNWILPFCKPRRVDVKTR